MFAIHLTVPLVKQHEQNKKKIINTINSDLPLTEIANKQKRRRAARNSKKEFLNKIRISNFHIGRSVVGNGTRYFSVPIMFYSSTGKKRNSCCPLFYSYHRPPLYIIYLRFASETPCDSIWIHLQRLIRWIARLCRQFFFIVFKHCVWYFFAMAGTVSLMSTEILIAFWCCSGSDEDIINSTSISIRFYCLVVC